MTLELDSDLITQVAYAVRQGERPQRALVRLGVHGSTAKSWLRRGEENLAEGLDPLSDVYAALWQAVDIAEADCELGWLKNAKTAAREGKRLIEFQSWMNLLQQRFPDGWGNKYKPLPAVAGPKSIEQALAQMQARGDA